MTPSNYETCTRLPESLNTGIFIGTLVGIAFLTFFSQCVNMMTNYNWFRCVLSR